MKKVMQKSLETSSRYINEKQNHRRKHILKKPFLNVTYHFENLKCQHNIISHSSDGVISYVQNY